MALPTEHDLSGIYRGTDYTHVFVFLDADGAEVDVSGYTFTAKGKDVLNGTTVVTFTASQPGSDQTYKVNGVDRTFDKRAILFLSLTDTVTGAIDSDYTELVYDLFQDIGGAISCPFSGKVQVRGRVTT